MGVSKDQIYTCGILTLSDKGSRGEREDTSGAMLREMLGEAGYDIVAYEVIPDRQELIEATLVSWADTRGIDLIVTTGGTGVSPSDVTPEATRNVIDREVPGIAEAMRRASLEKTVQAVWSRGIAGIRNETLIINLPGSKKAARENIEVVLPALRHGLYKLKGGSADCGVPDSH
ncbi:molybdenum cofactor biosynthesis protein [Desulfolithobacter dissulfuricans]|uniref:Molybdenum cofactor biosynthesis protein B n=1 Tax=Desulfolithobacter dissulfuricans TaxID=2795293 RepID=A0A915U5C0_9BACT|nr:MogA/MoaB family molybdenum cofactor biosynthesis protein [Desulfolithobacter dissulfuricans]BCO08902.1 molybdenum cofactor biosynthesis protein [Desulfolithobacter dissulfuricans]